MLAGALTISLAAHDRIVTVPGLDPCSTAAGGSAASVKYPGEAYESRISNMTAEIKGVIHGKVIELDHAPSLPDGQSVGVTVRPIQQTAATLAPGEGLRRSAGGWADDPDGLDGFWNGIAGTEGWIARSRRSELPDRHRYLLRSPEANGKGN